jgi:hypothetical protein
MGNPYSALVERRHPEYDARLAHWDFLESCYEGGREWFGENIFRYLKEGDREFKDRVARAYRFNHSREIVDLLNKYLFRAGISRNTDDAPSSVQEFWKKATKNGTPIEGYVKRLSKMGSTFGRGYVVIDSNAPDGIISVAEAKKLSARAYSYFVKPQDALDMSFDDFGQLNWILLRERFRDDADPLSGSGVVAERYRLWTRSQWLLLVEDASENRAKNKSQRNRNRSGERNIKIQSSGEHGLGFVPVIPQDHLDDDNLYYSPALINDIAYLDRAVANYLSNLDAIIQDQTFSQLALPAQALMPGDEENIEKRLIELGTKRLFIYNAEGGVPPQFLSPDPRQAQLIITAIRTIINEIYHTVGMAGERTKQDNSMGIDNSSGVAKAFDFDRVTALLVSKADGLERLENEMARIVAAWHGEKIKEDVKLVSYPRDFDVRSLLNEFDVAQRLALIDAPEKIRQHQLQALIDKLWPTLKKSLRDEMLKEVEEWPAEPELDDQPAPGAAKKPAAPAAKKRPTQGSKQAAK